jgi:YD repeat-containing protein
LLVPDTEYDAHTIRYQYDLISRLLSADYYAGINLGADPFREYAYAYDTAGNLTDINGTTRTYNAVNQLVNDGTNTLTYDANGNMTDDGVNTHVWDRANRLLSMGGHSYAYDGLGARISQTVSSVVTDYLLDVQPRLAQVISATTGMSS